MPKLSHLVAVFLCAAFGVGLLGACGGGSDEKEATATPVVTEEPTPEATEEMAATPTEGVTAPSAYDSFHYTVDLEVGISQPGETDTSFVSGNIEGDFVAPESHAFTSTFGFATLSLTEEVVIIGDDAWIRQGSGDWTATTRDDPEITDAIDLTSADPTFLSAEDLAEGLSVLDSESEEMNGVQTRRYNIPREAVETLSELLGEDFLSDTAGLQDFDMTVWLDDENDSLVRAELNATAGPEIFADSGLDVSLDATATITMVINLTQINDSSIAIEAPI